MKRLLTLLTVLFATLTAFAQGDSPYARFGYEGKVLRTPQERQQRMMLVVPNPDTTATVAKVGLDPAQQKYYLFDKHNQIIASDTLAGTTVSRFLSVDPLTANYPWYTPYQFAGNTPIQALDLDGLEEYHYYIKQVKDSRGKPQLVVTKTIEYNEKYVPDFLEPDHHKIIAPGGEGSEFTFSSGAEVHGFIKNKTLAQLKQLGLEEGQRQVTQALLNVTLWSALNDIQSSAEGAAFSTYGPLGPPLAPMDGGKITRAVGAAAKGFKPADFEYLKPEAGYLKGKKHGLDWNEAKALANTSGTPQGKWGSLSDLQYASKMANTLEPGQGGYFPLPAGSSSTVTMPDGSVTPATNMWLRNNGTGTFHGYPTLDSGPKSAQ